MYNSEKLATYGIQDEKQHNTICVGHHYRQTNTNNINKTYSPYKQLEVKTLYLLHYFYEKIVTDIRG